jgi:Sigma-70 region 2
MDEHDVLAEREHDVLADRFEVHRARLRAVAYQTLGAAGEADDAVQETWLRLSRTDPGNIENLGGWLTTVVARVCLNMTQQRAITDAFLTAARGGDFDALLAVLDPDVVVRSNGTEAVRGAAAVAGRAFPFTRIAQLTVLALIDGAAGVVTAADGRPITLVRFTITGAKIVAIDLIDEPRRIADADLTALGR